MKLKLIIVEFFVISLFLAGCHCVEPFPKTYITSEIKVQTIITPKPDINALKEESTPASATEIEGQLSFY